MMTDKTLELYLHIPFCIKKCAYCDFLSGPADDCTKARYTDALVQEIRRRSKKYSKYQVSTVFMGGGTPSVLDGESTARIFHALKENFRIAEDAEITMEVNPGTVTEEKADAWKKCGINRLSIGLQSADDAELKFLGRIHTFRDFLHTWKIVRSCGFDNVNIDLISAIPGQTEKSWEKTLRTAAELDPEHISAYSLIVEEGTPFYEIYGEQDFAFDREYNSTKNKSSVPSLPDEETERRIYSSTQQILGEYGFHRYEISNYAKEGYECRHNLGYWERKEYLGLGLGASSLICERRFKNTDNLSEYLKMEDDCFMQDCEILSIQDQMEEFMFLGLRKTDGIREAAFAETFGQDIDQVYGDALEKLEKQNLIRRKDGRINLTDRGTDISNYVFCEFIF